MDAIVTDLPYGVRSAAAGPPGATPEAMLDALLVLAARAETERARRRLAAARRTPRRRRRRSVRGRCDVRGAGRRDVRFVRVRGGATRRRNARVRRPESAVRLDTSRRFPRGTRRPEPKSSMRRRATRPRGRRRGGARGARRRPRHALRAAPEREPRARRGERRPGHLARRLDGDVAATRRLLSFGRMAKKKKADGEEEPKSEEEENTSKNDVYERRTSESARSMSRVLHVREPAGARNTPLTCAAMYGRNAVVALLLDLGADADGDHGVAPNEKRVGARRRTARRSAAPPKPSPRFCVAAETRS